MLMRARYVFLRRLIDPVAAFGDVSSSFLQTTLLPFSLSLAVALAIARSLAACFPAALSDPRAVVRATTFRPSFDGADAAISF